MTIITSSSATNIETALQKELRLFGELFTRMRDAFLNRIFDLRPEKARRRMQYLFILFIVSGFVISLRVYPLTLWTAYIRDVFYYLFNPVFAASFGEGAIDPITKFVNFLFQVFTDPEILQYLPIFLAPFFIALQSAGIYLADIFELDDVSVARKFITEVALTGSDETIRITQGEIFDNDRSSPNYLIGGPGKVTVDIDSVALFEKPDGTTRVIGPTGKEPRGKATLDGFERFRQAIDLRDHFIELRDLIGKTSAVKSRSLDGLPITATDVRFMFSVHRDGQKPTLDNPYPFSQKAIEQLVYKATSRVTPDLTNPSTFEFSWINNMVSLIRGRLGSFMNEHKLTEYLASIGIPEFERAKKQEDNITEQVQKLASSTQEDLPKAKEIKPPPEFTPRYMIKNLFSQFTEEFSNNARDRGVELHWIGVGTWITPVEIVPEKHLEAWKISRDNLSKGNDGAMEGSKNEVIVQEIMALIQNVPVAAHKTATDEQPEHKKAMQALLLAYRQQLIGARDFILAKGDPVPKDINDAINNINKAFGHFI